MLQGNLALHHKGNIRLQAAANSYINQYESARSRAEKSTVVSLVPNSVREERGRFVRKDHVNIEGRYTSLCKRKDRTDVPKRVAFIIQEQYGIEETEP